MWRNFKLLLGYNLRTVILFEVIYKLMTVLVFLPLLAEMFFVSMKITGYPYLAPNNIEGFLLNPIVWLMAIVAIIALTAFTVFDVATVIVIFDHSWHQHKIKLWQAVQISAQKLRGLINHRNILMPLVVLVLLPFVSVGFAFGINRHLALPEFIDNFIFSNPLLLALTILVILVLTILLTRWMYAFHYYVLENCDFKKARAKSRQLIKTHMVQDFGLILVVQVIYTIATIIFTAILSLIAVPLTYALISERFYAHKKQKHEKILPCKSPSTHQLSPKRRYAMIVVTIGALVVGGVIHYTIGSGKYLFVDARTEPIEITAHRGFSSEYPENTMSAFRAAVENGADCIELDVRQTKDHQIVVSHDSNTKRMTGVDKNIWETDYAELAQLDFGSKTDPKFAGEKIPLLSEVLELANKTGVHLNIEIKASDHDNGIEGRTIDLIRKYHQEQNSMISSLNYDTLHTVKSIDSSIQTLYVMVFAYGDISQIPDVDAYSIESTSISSKLVATTHAVGKPLVAWTADDEDTMQYLNVLGVDNVITNRLPLANDTLKNNPDPEADFWILMRHHFNF